MTCDNVYYSRVYFEMFHRNKFKTINLSFLLKKKSKKKTNAINHQKYTHHLTLLKFFIYRFCFFFCFSNDAKKIKKNNKLMYK